MGLDSIATTAQQPPNGDGADVTDLVLQDLLERREAGTRKYGRPLRTFNGRRADVDAYQEALDLTVYLRQHIEEERQASRAGVHRVPQITLTDKVTVRPVQKMGGDHMVVAAARVSTCGEEALAWADSSKAEECAGLINYLMQHRHGTPFEHGALTFFVHAPIFVWREWHRHRIGFSYNETSGRYSKLEPVFWVPPDNRRLVPAPGHTSARPKFQEGTAGQLEEVRETLAASYHSAYLAYCELLEKGYAKEVCRALLPVGIYSSCWVTCNPRSLMAFLSLRTHEPSAKFVSYPQAEIEAAARAAEEVLREGWPLTHAAFVKNGRVGP